MKRLATLVILAVIGTAAALTDAPAPTVPAFTGPSELGPATAARASVWYCPWLDAGAEEDSYLLLASEVATDAVMTFPSLLPDEPAEESTVGLAGPGSRIVEVGDIVRRGDAPALVEFGDGPAAAVAAVVAPAVLAADACVAAVPKIWHLPGGTTREGFSYAVRLFNPFPDDVKVTITGSSEFGAEPLPDLSVIDVPGRSWRNVELDPIAPLLDDLSLVVTTEEGVIIPVASLAGRGDQATWSGAGLAATWTFPIAGVDGTAVALAISNPGSEPGDVTIDAVTADGTIPGVVSATVAPAASARLELTDLVAQPFGLVVRSTTPLAAVVIATDEAPSELSAQDDEAPSPATARVAGVAGAIDAASSWLLPGAGGVPGATASIWVQNPGGEQVTVTMVPLGVRDLPVDKLVVPAGASRRFPVPDDVAIAGYLLEAPVPIVASWSAATAESLAFVSGVPVDG